MCGWEKEVEGASGAQTFGLVLLRDVILKLSRCAGRQRDRALGLNTADVAAESGCRISMAAGRGSFGSLAVAGKVSRYVLPVMMRGRLTARSTRSNYQREILFVIRQGVRRQ